MYTRNCPNCGKLLHHTTKGNCQASIKKQRVCSECHGKKCQVKFKGEGNPFYGKKHQKQSKDKMKIVNKDHLKTDEFRRTMSEATFKRNENFEQKSNYEYQVIKYGKEKADLLQLEWKEKLSKAFSGKNNPMYGKPTPIGSGNGWSGWYKNWYFRSLKELSYMILIIEKNNYSWIKGENKKFKIKYKDFNGHERTYAPDFVINDKNIIEIKPKNLFNSDIVKSKTEAILKFCESNGYTFEIIDPKPLKECDIIELHEKGLIKFIDRYEAKYQEKYQIKNETN